MAVLAGTMRATPTAAPEWVACDGKPYYVLAKVTGLPKLADPPGWGDRRDYPRRVGRKYGFTGLGPLGFRFNVPKIGSTSIKTNDDKADT